MTGDAVEYGPRTPNWLRPLRSRLIALPGGLLIWRFLVGIIGLAVVVLGALLVPLPGPGWAIVFLGVGVWAIEFHWAQRLLIFLRARLRQWTQWMMRQSRFVQFLVGAAGLAFLGGMGWVALVLLG
jgi:uncharacterized protein (TIGR02611 family)